MSNKIILKNNIQLLDLPKDLLELLKVKNLPSQNQALCLLSVKKRIIGIIIFIEVPPEIEILDFAVISEFQNQHFGTDLLYKLINFAKDKKFSKILLEVNEKNDKALHIYKKANFNEVGSRKEYYNNQDKAFLMEKII